eukprot:TRINITY_DN45575_c0_g1_i1.p1 TRINITY_DN45575_c0_g1~~TRINITY_DN45575_c0_g1_i1.p1  ORF type:complete len:679 (-),score=75.37 TRINITY_DN45575_c0_g1_i1:118-2154(-)
MYERLRAFVSFVVSAHFVSAENANEKIGCTAIAIDGAASVDGSAFTGMNADSSNADYRLTFIQPQLQRDSMRPVYTSNLSYPRWVGFGRGEIFYPQHPDQPLTEPVGYIPSVQQTYGYYESTQPLMNDQGLGIGESSCACMLVNRLVGSPSTDLAAPTGMLDTVSMMQIALERCATARCAVELMGQLSEQFGFVPTPGEPTVGRVSGQTAWDDAGEAFTLADSRGEAWVFHVLGGVSGIVKSVWVAQKVPKGHIAVIANEFTIGELPLKPNDDVLFNEDIRRAALVAGLWNGHEPFHFARVFAPDPVTFETPTGETPIPLYGAVRRWALHNLAAPSKNYPLLTNGQEYPFSVKVEKKLSHRDVMNFFKYHYQGTEFDMTQGILAGPFGTPFRVEGGPKSGQVIRGISIQRTAYGIVVQTGPARQLAWFAMDCPLTSIYVPLDSKVEAVSAAYSSGHNGNFSRDTAGWAFNFVNNFMQLNYRSMSQDTVYPLIEALQDEIDLARANLEGRNATTAELASWQLFLQDDVVKRWWQLADLLVMKYNDGRINVPKIGKSIGYPQWYADMVGFGNDVHPVWVQPAPRPAASVARQLYGYVPPTFRLPAIWQPSISSWSYYALISEPDSSLALSFGASSSSMFLAVFVLLLLATTCYCGVTLGRRLERYHQRCDGEERTYVRFA